MSTPTYEIHIAAEVLSAKRNKALFAALASIGLTKNKFFYLVANIRAITGTCQSPGTPPTGHDLEQPGSMTTAKVRSYEKARELLLKGMQILAEHGVKGNFEIEGLIAPTIPDYPIINISSDFPGYRRADDAPLYENHVIWKGPGEDLPNLDQITRFFVRELRFSPHQIVDFGRDELRASTTVVSRVATVYQPSRESTLKFAEEFSRVKNVLGCRYSVMEQVVLVGEPI